MEGLGFRVRFRVYISFRVYNGLGLKPLGPFRFLLLNMAFGALLLADVFWEVKGDHEVLALREPGADVKIES